MFAPHLKGGGSLAGTGTGTAPAAELVITRRCLDATHDARRGEASRDGRPALGLVNFCATTWWWIAAFVMTQRGPAVTVLVLQDFIMFIVPCEDNADR